MIYGSSTEQSVPKAVLQQIKYIAPESSVISKIVLAAVRKIFNISYVNSKSITLDRNIKSYQSRTGKNCLR